jgi:hypothetical protein
MKEVPRSSEGKRKYAPYDLLYDGINLAEKINGMGEKLIIPRHYLFGTQEVTEYSQLKRKQVVQDLEIKGIDYLLENPIIVMACEFPKGMQLVVIDGHHRVRYAPQFHILDIPSLVVNPETLTSVINNEKGKDLNPDVFCHQMQQNAADALKSFADKIPNFKSRDFVFGASSIAALKHRFPSF